MTGSAGCGGCGAGYCCPAGTCSYSWRGSNKAGLPLYVYVGLGALFSRVGGMAGPAWGGAAAPAAGPAGGGT